MAKTKINSIDTFISQAKILSTSNGKAMILSKCVKCGSKQSQFLKNEEAKGLLSNLGIRTPLNKVPILGDILFWIVRIKWMKQLTSFY